MSIFFVCCLKFNPILFFGHSQKGLTYEELKKQLGEDGAGVTSVSEVTKYFHFFNTATY